MASKKPQTHNRYRQRFCRHFSFFFAAWAVLDFSRDLLHDSSSTAALGFIFAPVLFVWVAAPMYCIGWTLTVIFLVAAERRLQRRLPLVGVLALLLASLATQGQYWLENLALQKELAAMQAMSTAELHALLSKPGALGRRDVVLAAVCNKQLSEQDLISIAKLPDLSYSKSRVSFFVTEGCDYRGRPLLADAALHPNAGLELLDILRLNAEDEILVATSRKLDELQGLAAAQTPEGKSLVLQIRQSTDKARKDSNDATARFYKQIADHSVRSALGEGNDTSITGCSAGLRLALNDVTKYPTIAACGAGWSRSSMDAAKDGNLCGGYQAPFLPDCAVPANACAAKWHICGALGRGAKELSSVLSAQECTHLAPGRFIAALPDTDCGSCGTGPGKGAVCCGESCLQHGGSCVWEKQTAWAGFSNGHANSCGDIEMPSSRREDGVLCCRD